jgi:hypothetical protein
LASGYLQRRIIKIKRKTLGKHTPTLALVGALKSYAREKKFAITACSTQEWQLCIVRVFSGNCREIKRGTRFSVNGLWKVPHNWQIYKAFVGNSPNSGEDGKGVPRLRHTVSFTDETTPSSKAKPDGVMGCEIWVKVGKQQPTDPSQLQFLGTDTRTPYVAEYGGGEAGKAAHYMLRWVNTKGEQGPWSQTVSATITG